MNRIPYFALLFILLFASCKNEELHTVTVNEFAAFVNATEYITDAEKFGWSIVQKDVENFEIVDNASWKYPDAENPSDGAYPVTQVSYNDALAYAKWAHSRLPTYSEYWKLARKDKRMIHQNAKAMLPNDQVNVVGNVWDITEPRQGDEVHLAGGSYLCNGNTCNGTSAARELWVDKFTGNLHIGFSIVVDKK